MRRAILVSLAVGLVQVALHAQVTPRLDIAALERTRILPAAAAFLRETPITVTASHCPRSAGGIHDFYSEGDYWWPDPKTPDGPYILLFGGLGLGEPTYLDLWKTLAPPPAVEEVIRNLPIRHPLLWVDALDTAPT